MKCYGIFMRFYCGYTSYSACHRLSSTTIRLEGSKYKVPIGATDNVQVLLKSFRNTNRKLQTVRQTFSSQLDSKDHVVPNNING